MSLRLYIRRSVGSGRHANKKNTISKRPMDEFVKREFIKHRYYFETRSEMIRFAMTIFRDDITFDDKIARRITGLLHEQKFTTCEIHAILLHYGFIHKTKDPKVSI
jgi:hypothetical protein